MSNEPNQRRTTLRRCLLINVAGMVALLSLTVILATWLGSARTIRMVAESITGEQLELAEAQLRGFLEPLRKHLFETAAWGKSGILDVADARSAESLLEPIMRQYPQVTAARIADERGRELTIIRDELQWTIRRVDPETLEDGLAEFTEWAENNPRRTEQLPIDYNVVKMDWFWRAANILRSQRGRETETPIYWSLPYQLTTRKRPGYTGSLAFRSRDDIVTVVAFDLLCYDVHEFTSRIGAKRNDAIAFAITSKQALLGLPRTTQAMTVPEIERLLLKRADQVGMPLVADAARFLLPSADSGNPIEFISEGETWWGEAQTFFADETFEDPEDKDDLLVAVLIPEHRLLGGLWTQMQWITAIFVFASAIVMLWTVRLASVIGHPIEVLVDRGEKLSRGILDDNTRINSNISEVVKFNDVLEDMQDSLGMLFRVERSLQLARAEDAPNMQITGFDVATWGEKSANRTGNKVQQAVPHQTTTTWDQIISPQQDSAVLMLADATGDGLESEFLAAQVHSMVRMAADLNPDVRAAAQAVNDQLYSDMTQGRFVSAWLGRLSTTSDALVSCPAGLDPTFHYACETSTCHILRSNSMPLGVFDDSSTVNTVAIPMKPGDVFCVLSDRVFSFSNAADRELEPEVIGQIIAKHATASAQSILAAIRAETDAFLGDTPRAFGYSIVVIKKT